MVDRRSSRVRVAGTDLPICHLAISLQAVQDESSKVLHDVYVYLSQNGGVPVGKDIRLLRIADDIQYKPFCDDFGPMSALSIINFVVKLDCEIHRRGKGQNIIVFAADEGPRALTNAAFLLGAYMILKLDRSSAEVAQCFRSLQPSLFEPYRDAAFTPSDFDLELIDCWRGLEKSKSRGWIALPSSADPAVWGKIDKDAYAHYENPLNADLHEIVPEKLIAFRGPRDLGGREFTNTFKDGVFISREFSPQYYIDIFAQLSVSTIIRTNEARYDADCFVSAGLEHHDLYFEDCSSPPPAVVSRFFKIVDEAKGAVAIHGRAGLGRAGTLIALYLMRCYGFDAREAIAWLRIVRPGAVIGRQQHFLIDTERSIRSLIAAAPGGKAPRAAVAAAAAAPAVLPRARASKLSAAGATDAGRPPALVAAAAAEGARRRSRECAAADELDLPAVVTAPRRQAPPAGRPDSATRIPAAAAAHAGGGGGFGRSTSNGDVGAGGGYRMERAASAGGYRAALATAAPANLNLKASATRRPAGPAIPERPF